MRLDTKRRSLSVLLGLPSLAAAALLGAPRSVAAPQGDEIPDFATEVLPLFDRYCFDCHGVEFPDGDVRLDKLDPDMVAGSDAEHWAAALDMIQGGDMPPRSMPQPTDDERRLITRWVEESLELAARAHAGERRAVIRRLNKAQYTWTLQDLLGVHVDFGRVLPDDGKSEMGFTNNGEVLLASPLHVDYYRAIAREALDQAIAIGPKPPVTRYRVTFGRDLGRGHVAAETGGYQSVPLSADDFVVDVLDDSGEPRTATSDEEREALDSIRRTISIGLRGSSRDRFRVVDEGMMLYAAKPHVERVPKAWQGPSPNVKLQMQRSFPERGDLAFRVRASKGYLLRNQEEVLIELESSEPSVTLGPNPGQLITPEGARVFAAEQSDDRKNAIVEYGWMRPEVVDQESSVRFRFDLEEDAYFQVDLVHPFKAADGMPSARLTVDGSTLDRRFELERHDGDRYVSTLGAVYLQRGTHTLRVGGPFFIGFQALALTPLAEDHPAMPRLKSELLPPDDNDDRVPVLRAFAGTRVDDGMDYSEFAHAVEVTAPFGAPQTYQLIGRLEDLPIPEPESGDTEILSGIMLLGLWNEHLVHDAQDPGPPLLIESLEFEAPYLPEWPPASHRRIFIESEARGDEVAYTREVLAAFLERAFRRPLAPDEVERYVELWRELRGDFETYEESVREVLVAVLCSPHFLFLAEPPQGDAALLAPQALATRLAYFLWNSPPDEELLELAAEGRLHAELDAQVDRMLDDERSARFARAFATEWLRLDRHATIDVNVGVYPDFTRFVKRDMAEETVRFLHHVMAQDQSVFTLIDSDYAMLNQNLAEFYGVEGVVGPHFRPVPVAPEARRGGLLSQGAFLSGHSDGTQAHPIKRAVWLKEKILGDRPPDPPPNVPDLDPDAEGFAGLTLKEQLEKHRDSPSCNDCHAGIDPYGIVFERYDAVGRWNAVRTLAREGEAEGTPIDAATVLPDGRDIDGVDAMKAYIVEEQADAFIDSLVEHLFAYALGRDLHYADAEELKAIREHVRSQGDTMRAVIKGIVTTPAFTQP